MIRCDCVSFKTNLHSPLTPCFADFRVDVFGFRESHQYSISIPRGRECYTLLFFYEDNFAGIHALDPIGENSLMLFPPHVPFFYGRERMYWTHSHLALSGGAAARIIADKKVPLQTPMHLGSPQLIEDIVMEYQELTLGGMRPIDAKAAQVSFEKMVALLPVESTEEQSHLVPDIMRDIRDHIFQHYRDHVSVHELAEQCGLSTSYFATQFKILFGVSPKELLIDLRIGEAKKNILSQQNPNIQAVANSVGYADVYHFSKIFHKHTGMSPSQYRKRACMVCT